MYSDVKGAIIYCDVPYKNTSQKYYKSFNNSVRGKGKIPTFDTETFWNWAQKMANNSNTVFVSERQCPDKENIKEIWSGRNRKEVLYVVEANDEDEILCKKCILKFQWSMYK